jgi:hypothetical protein
VARRRKNVKMIMEDRFINLFNISLLGPGFVRSELGRTYSAFWHTALLATLLCAQFWLGVGDLWLGIIPSR